ncbi:MAG TPA: UDP-N-acetylmuramate dehydrogenase [Candidatus Cloacimonas sp.]|nr:UDP-N-acetylmuramate dehydrogenase [Candidatus Cloacimonas sp.]
MDTYLLLRKEYPQLIDDGIIHQEVSLKEHCSFKIGGTAEIFCIPNTQKQLLTLLKFCLWHNIPYFILGKGSNLLISDKGIKGIVITTERFNKITLGKRYLSASCGVTLKDLGNFACENGLSGLEFCSGIPGSVGGAVFMNAGAYGKEIKDVLYSSRAILPDKAKLDSKNPVIYLKATEHNFSYRHSVFQEKGLIHLSSRFCLKKDKPENIRERMQELQQKRQDKQPMDLPSAGSVFKRPEGFFTGKLIEDCGLKGFRIGDAAVSEKHCGFIVNIGSATAKDVLQLIQHIQKTVYERYSVHLQTEIRMVGEL